MLHGACRASCKALARCSAGAARCRAHGHGTELPEFHAQVLYATGLTWLHRQLTLIVWSWHGLAHSPQALQGWESPVHSSHVLHCGRRALCKALACHKACTAPCEAHRAWHAALAHYRACTALAQPWAKLAAPACNLCILQSWGSPVHGSHVLYGAGRAPACRRARHRAPTRCTALAGPGPYWPGHTGSAAPLPRVARRSGPGGGSESQGAQRPRPRLSDRLIPPAAGRRTAPVGFAAPFFSPRPGPARPGRSNKINV